MSPFQKSLVVFLGAGVGANARFWIGIWIPTESFPWSTFLINILGSLLIGGVAAVPGRAADSEGLRLLVIVGLLGGFTTFSSFSLETLKLVESRQVGLALVYAVGTTGIGLLACWFGWITVRTLVGS